MVHWTVIGLIVKEEIYERLPNRITLSLGILVADRQIHVVGFQQYCIPPNTANGRLDGVGYFPWLALAALAPDTASSR